MQANNSAILTDFYQLTMAYAYFKLGMHEQNACFHMFFRHNPFDGQYALSAGLETAIEYLSAWQFTDSDVNYLASLKNHQNQPHFSEDFLQYLQNLKFTCHVDAIPEGNLIFPEMPYLRIEGPILQCQLVESPLLNIMNFQTLIASKASRICRAAGDDPVIEFGLRRAQGNDGALAASRAAYIGGCTATSNTLAGKLYDIPLRGTHAHSFVTAFDSEQIAFDAYASVMPGNAVLLVDTFNTITGVEHAIKTGLRLREKGADLLGIRLDSGNVWNLSITARKLLDDAGFQNTFIMASNTLNEYIIADLKSQGAKISAWGVGTQLVTAYDQPALDGVYKLSAIQDKNSVWQPKLKLSEQEIKISNPGRQQVRRYVKNGKMLKDIIYDIDLGIDNHAEMDAYDEFHDLLTPVMVAGKRVAIKETIHDIRTRSMNYFAQMNQLENETHQVRIEKKLHELKIKLIQDNRVIKGE